MIRIVLKQALLPQHLLANDATDQDEVARLDDPGQLIQKAFLFLPTAKQEASFLLADVVLMQNDDVVSDMAKLERFDLGDHRVCVMSFVKNTKRQNKDWVIGIYPLNTVITALVDVHDVITELRRYRRSVKRHGLKV